MNVARFIRWGCIALGLTLFLFGCAGTGKNVGPGSADEASSIDQLLGVGDASTENEIQEDDVLKLLGVADESVETTPSTATQTLGTAEQAESQVDASGGSAAEPMALNQEASSPSRIPAGQPADRRSDRQAPAFQTDSYADRYQEALQTYRARNYRNAIQKFEALLATDSRHSLADNCQYWIGESYYDMQNYQQAIVAFEKVFTHSKSNKDDSAQLKLGMCYLRLDEKGKAKEEFQKLVHDYPASEYVGIAKRFLAQIDGTASTP